MNSYCFVRVFAMLVTKSRNSNKDFNCLVNFLCCRGGRKPTSNGLLLVPI